MARGGRRSGTPGRAYGNRKDLNKPKLPVQAPPSQQYGERARLEQAQQAVPMGGNPNPTPAPTPPPQGSVGSGGPGPGPAVPAGSLRPFAGPTASPNEPITTGLPSGPGAGPEILNRPGAMSTDPLTLQLRALAQVYPIPEILEMLEED